VRGEELTPWLIRYAYAQGAFPMTMEDGRVEWFQPFRRALFPLEGIHVSRSLRKTLRRQTFEVRFDTAFEEVMRGCLREDDENWISEHFIRVYSEIHRQGWAHCAETWRDGRLVGGVYGIALGSCFCAESMFHRETDASKVALWALVDRCRELGFSLFDAQIMNPHLESLGAFEVPHRQYMRMLERALARQTPWSVPDGATRETGAR
jgi:leucyl/phenylalanyl-tRNA---protein transferase